MKLTLTSGDNNLQIEASAGEEHLLQQMFGELRLTEAVCPNVRPQLAPQHYHPALTPAPIPPAPEVFDVEAHSVGVRYLPSSVPTTIIPPAVTPRRIKAIKWNVIAILLGMSIGGSVLAYQRINKPTVAPPKSSPYFAPLQPGEVRMALPVPTPPPLPKKS